MREELEEGNNSWGIGIIKIYVPGWPEVLLVMALISYGSVVL